MRGCFATVDDTRGLTGVAQAAARTRTLLLALESDDFHVILRLLPATRQ
ncbi:MULTISPECIES: ribose-phosphate pyrophosphokinase [Burkholderia]|nr:ribose-phosphate pyrophosphokinase [Burkholderia sp. AU28942]